MMRKLVGPVAVALVLTVILTSGVMAAGKPPAAPYGASQCPTWIDENGDGVCDTAGPLAPQDGTGNQYGSSNSPGQSGGSGAGIDNPPPFADPDGDGECDNVPPQDGTGNKVQRSRR